MHIAPSSNSPKKSLKQKQSKLSPQSKSQDGSRLLSPDFPPEALNWTTSFLIPEDLLSLGSVSNHLHSHVALDATWRSAFLRYSFGLDPETDFGRDKQILLKRTCSTWREEYITRFQTIHRWRVSKAQTVSHSPHHSVGYPIYWSSEVSGLLSASTTYGVVARSSPATGATIKGRYPSGISSIGSLFIVSPGFLDAQGLMNGAGIGNPNVEFSPDVSAVSPVAVGGTAYVTWGYRNGSVAITYAPNFMELTDKHRAYKRCEARDAHGAQVSHIVFCDKTLSFVSGAWDGTVKLWSADPLNLLWDSGKNENATVGDACMQVAWDSNSGTVVAAFANGVIKVWTGLVVNLERPSGAGPLHPDRADVIQPLSPPTNTLPWEADPVTLSVSVSPQHVSILVHANKDTYIGRIIVPRTGTAGNTARSLLTDGPLGSLTAITPSYATSTDVKAPTFPMFPPAPLSSPLAAFAATLQEPVPVTQTSFVAAGDILGRICIWDLDQPGDIGPQGNIELKSFKRFQAHDDGAVTAITLSPHVWVTGSARGTIRLWDSISFTLLRTFETPCPRPHGGTPWPKVEQIIVDRAKDIFLASVGSCVLYWKPGRSVGSSGKGKGKAKSALGASKPSAERWHRDMEIKNALQHTQDLLNAERRGVVHAHRRQVEQNDALAALGLDEVGAVEYALMLSRDQAEERRLTEALAAGPFEDYPNQQGVADEVASPPLSPTSSVLSKRSSPPTPVSASLPRSFPSPAPISFYSSHYANPNPARIQVSPTLPPEPIEAGFAVTPLSGSPAEVRTPRASSNSPPTLDAGIFPKISPKSLAKKQSFTSGSSSRDSRRSGSGQSAWSRPMTPKATPTWSGPSNLTSRRPAQAVRPQRAVPPPAGSVDEDLEFAIRLSLAEAQSREEWQTGQN
ncbi:hypothetical protein FRC01_013312 [Tulasnella sp. 417]|nr:hypothetical protein FRC01_013312 [Tulasnella sp. 417]